MKYRVKTYIEWLEKSDYKGDFIDGAFQLLIDNRINSKELKEILAYKNYILPEEFFNLHYFEQKKYRQYTKTIYEYIDGEWEEDEQYIFNRPFFDELVANAKKDKTKEGTTILIDYLLSIGELNYFFFGIDFVELKKTSLINIPGMSRYLNKNPTIKTLYDLLVTLIPIKNRNEDFELLRKKVINHLKENKDYDLNLLDGEIFFFLIMESFLYRLPRKERNTIKAKCLIMEKKYLHEDEYHSDTNKVKRIHFKNYLDKADIALLEYHKDIFDVRCINKTNNTTIINSEYIKNFSPNGYSELYELVKGEIYE